MANFNTLQNSTTNSSTDRYLTNQNGIDYEQNREQLVGSIGNGRWDSNTNYDINTQVTDSNGDVWIAVVNTGPAFANVTNPITADLTVWKAVNKFSPVKNLLEYNQNWTLGTEDGSITSVNQTFTVGQKPTEGYAVVTANLVDVKRVGGVTTATSGFLETRYKKDSIPDLDANNLYASIIDANDNQVYSGGGTGITLANDIDDVVVTIDFSIVSGIKILCLAQEKGRPAFLNDEQSLASKPATPNKNLLDVTNNIEPFDNGVDTPPDATPRNYSTGYMMSVGWTVGVGLVNFTRVTSLMNADSGTLYADVNLAENGLTDITSQLIASVAGTDGAPSTTGVSVDLVVNPGYARVIVDFSVVADVFTIKLEKSSFATDHELQVIDNKVITLVNSLGGSGVNEKVSTDILATIGVNTVWSVTNPFPNAKLLRVKMQIFTQNRWNSSYGMSWSGVIGKSYGFHAEIIDETTIRMETGDFIHILTVPTSTIDKGTADILSAPVRLVVEKVL